MSKPAWAQITAGLMAGFLLGGAFGVWRARSEVPDWMKYSREERNERMLRQFSEELRITPAQQAEVKRALDSASEQTRAWRADTRPKYRAIRAEMSRAIRALLDEEQTKRFDAIEKEWDARKEQWGKKRDGGS